MIGINESNPNIHQIEKKHIHHVQKRVAGTIGFYIDTFEYLIATEKKRISNPTVNAKIKSFKTLNHCGHFKALLNRMQKTNKKIKTEDDLHLIREASNRINGFKNLKPLLTGLKALKKRYPFLLAVNFTVNYKRYHAAYQQVIKACAPAQALAEQIFDYEWFTRLSNSQPWGPYRLTGEIGLNCCPYCNRQYTFTVNYSNGKKITRPQLDHFLPQSKHPWLALSFYNLIPSCSVCNSSIKGAADTSYLSHVNPYELNPRHELLRFSYTPQSYAGSIGERDEIQVEVKYNGSPTDLKAKTKAEGNIELFCLGELYENHKDTVKDIIQIRSATNDQYIRITQKTFKNLNLSIEDAYRIAYGNYYFESDFHKRPLSKLTKDIAIELGTLPKFPKPKK